MDRHPTADEHLAFLVKLQRLLSEGDFTATYKFALLMALADISVERGHDDVRPLDISMRDIAENFIECYWQQTNPYGSGVETTGGAGNLANLTSGIRSEVYATPATQFNGVISQNMGATAKVVSDIQTFRQSTHTDSIVKAKQAASFGKLVTSIAQTVSAQPVTYFQNIAGATDAFVYERIRAGLRLKPGVSSHLRKFHGLIQHMTRDRWVRHIKNNKRNIPILGQKEDLYAFLFQTNRNALGIISTSLSKLNNKTCFYCRNRINGTPDVDHFIPFSVYGRDIVQNFVLAHASCNRSKSDVLAAKPHIQKWLESLDKYQDDINQIAQEAGVISDHATILSVANWTYQQGHQAGAHAWIRKGEFERIEKGYAQILC